MEFKKVFFYGDINGIENILLYEKSDKIEDLNKGMLLAASIDRDDVVQYFIDLGANNLFQVFTICLADDYPKSKTINLLLSKCTEVDTKYIDENKCIKFRYLKTLLENGRDVKEIGNSYHYILI